jgi:Predicted NAD/FAD-binding protein
MRVAVVGTGISGNAAAWTLSKHYPVTVYDRELRPGGHSHTVSIDYDGAQLAVDIGFIVYNELNYPDLTALFAHLGVETVESCMSFAVTADTGRFEWKGGGNNWFETARGLFAQASNLLSPSYLWMLRDIVTFNQQSSRITRPETGRADARRVFPHAPLCAAAVDRLSGADGRCDLVGAVERDAGSRPKISSPSSPTIAAAI